ncbi:2-oxoglutarate (2OG) and Fe(II)-dependent oxygenase superfamily protein [Wolffia australiana]
MDEQGGATWMNREPPRGSAGVAAALSPAAEKTAALAEKITAEGGFAFVGSLEKAAGGDRAAAEAAREMAWEQLHAGPWHSVVPAWRDAYAATCLYAAGFHADDGDLPEALKILDLGLIMGGLLLREDLERGVEIVLERSKGGSGGEDRGVCAGILGGIDRGNESEVLRDLPPGSLTSNMVGRQFSLSMERFICDYFQRGCPVVMVGSIDHWPALTKWKDLRYLEQVAGDRTVPVEVGKNYLCDEWKQELITFSEFLKRTISPESCKTDMTYLAQHPLFDQVQELRNDIMVPDYCFTGGGEIQSINAWFGPAGTVTPLHHDPHHNLLAQVVGKKYVRLYPASISAELYPHTETMLYNSSQVDLDSVDLEKFPKFEGLEFVDCILAEGEMLYIPPLWWHYVRSLTPSFSVSFWWAT